MKTLTQALQDAYAAPVQKPAWLVMIGWESFTSYLSSYGDVSWNGENWTAAPMDVRGIRLDGMKVSGSIILGNADDLYASMVLGDGVAGREIKIYGYDAGATSATDDVVALACCLGGRATVSPSEVNIALTEVTAFMYTPRQYVQPPLFKYLIPAGTTLLLNGASYTIDRVHVHSETR